MVAMLTFHPSCSGGGSPIAMSPLAATSALLIPLPFRTLSASSAAYPLAIPPRSNLILGASNVAIRFLGSRRRLLYPTARLASASSAEVGRTFRFLEKRHNRTHGHMV